MRALERLQNMSLKRWLMALVLSGVCRAPLYGQTRASEAKLKIGGIFDLTSEAGRIWGQAEKNAFLLAIRDFESRNAIKVESFLEDSAYSNTASVSAFQKLTSVNGVKYIVGPTWEMFVATMPLCERNKVVCLAPSNNSLEFDNPKLKFSFTAEFRENGYSDVIAAELNQKQLKDTIIFAAISPYADPLVENLLSKLKFKPAVVHRVLPANQDFRTLISKTPETAEALILFLLNDGQEYAFLKQWYEIKRHDILIYTDDSPIFDAALDKIRALKLDIHYSRHYFPPDVKKRWDSKYQAAYGQAPQAPSSSVAYDETALLLECAKKDPDPASVSSCIASTTGYPGYSGTISFAGKQVAQDRKFELKSLSE